MAKSKRKTLKVVVEVTVPEGFSAYEVRREVRTLINSQCFYAADEETLKAVSVKAQKRTQA